MRILGGLLAASLAVTEGILLAEGRWQEALPLHLCSVSALVALGLSVKPSAGALDFLWYLGMPGALLALLFPAPAVSRFQGLLNLSYAATHALILVIPSYALFRGMRIRPGRAGHMLLAVHGLAVMACAVNRLLGTDYLFLMAPPYGTPLCAVYEWGYGWYLLALELLVCALLLVTGRALPRRLPKLFAQVNV